MRSHDLRALGPLALASTLWAQGATWIVDQNNGAGTHFTDIPAAVAAVADGDTLLIRAGSYSPFETNKALTLLGQGTVVVADPLFPRPPQLVRVHSLPRGRTFTMKNVRIEARLTQFALSLASNVGRVHLEDVVVATASSPPSNMIGCIVVACTAVTFVNGSLFGYPALSASQSTLALAGTMVSGGSHCGSSRCLAGIGDGMVLQDCMVLLSRASVSGGSTFPGWTFDPRPAIVMARSQLIATGDASTFIAAGGGNGSTPIAAIETNQGTIHLDTRLLVRGSQGGRDVNGTAVVVRRRIVALSGAGAPPGGNVAVEVVSPAGDPFVFAASLPTDPLPHPSGLLFVDPQFMALFGFGVQNGNERSSTAVPVPNDPRLHGLVLAVQAGSLAAATQALEFSNPVVVVLH